MRTVLFALLVAQCCLTATAVILNGGLLFVMYHSKAKMGHYKHLMVAFTIFETMFAIVCLIGMPMHSISDRTWIEFTYYGPLGNTRLAKVGPILYCMMYEIWLGFIMLHFLYRYIVLCRPSWAKAIKNNSCVKSSVMFAIAYYLVICLVCSLYLCPFDVASNKLLKDVRDMFQLEFSDDIGYYVIRLTTLDGAFSLIGLLALLVHYTAVLGSVFLVAFCSYSIWSSIRKYQSNQHHVNVHLERQLFFTLLLQTIVPVFLCHLPSMFMLSFPLWVDNVTIGPLSSLFPLFLTLTKVIDPIVPILCIGDYRKTLRSLTCGQQTVSDLSGSVNMTGSKS